ncbi:hypothetical protein GMLC_32000 [Geomonas limicola]|uniref:Uncharacterized protein n=1 Tax=Geomonas limicola TaxID=2740186 RepID=A0A6V8NAU7_9BACT|nr:hypothetical protein [Geomonas limicola]GFO69621.1 hypothetical protein GMLC_32000 [Geomonas limicola]
MKDRDRKEEIAPVIVLLERRSQRQSDLSAAEVMRILRKRAAKASTSKGAAPALPPGKDSRSDPRNQ